MTKTKTLKHPNSDLIFVDTNIFLDFYRSRNETHLHLLKKLTGIKQQLITSFQVEMEFMKNRQGVLVKTLDDMKWPGINVPTPALLNDSNTKASISKLTKKIQKKHQTLKNRITRHLMKPLTDPVYKAFNALYSNPCLNLASDTVEAKRMCSLAWKRFMSGYPPRKNDSISTGDALNWEWILCCAKKENKGVIIVSRDQDYGLPEEGLVNDWLHHEFRRRMGRGKHISITNQLSLALESLSIPITKEEKDSEEIDLLANSQQDSSKGANAMESISSRLLTQLPQSSFENFNTLNMFTGANWAESLKSINHFSAEIQKSALAYKNLVPQFQNSAFLEQMQKMAAD